MLSLPNGFGDDNGGYHLSNQTPLSFHRQPESPGSGNDPAGGGYFDLTEQSFNPIGDQDLNLSLLVSGGQSFDMGHYLAPPGSSGISYVGDTAGNRITSPSELLPVPSGVSPNHAFPSHYSSVYEPNLLENTPQYSLGLPQLQSVNNALFLHSRNPRLHAPSPSGSDCSFDDPGSGYSSTSSMAPPPNATLTLPSHAETEGYLRSKLEIPPHLAVNLSALPDVADKKHPPIANMIKLAIWGSRDKMLTLRGIYNEIEKRYPSLKDLQDKPWQRSIRHNLSLKAIFVRLERPLNVTGSGHYWAINIRNGEGNKRDRKRKDAGSRGSSSRSRSDEEDEFSEEVDEDRPPAIRRGPQGDQRGLLMPRNPYEQYSAMGPSMFPSAPMQTSQMGYQPAMPPSRINQPSPQPQPGQMGPSSGRPNDFSAYPRGMTLPSTVEHPPFYRTTYGPIMNLPDQSQYGPYMQEQMNMPPAMAGLQMPPLGASPYGQGSGSRRPAPDEDLENRTNRRRTAD